MTSVLQQYIAEYTDTNSWHYSIRHRITFASALEFYIISIYSFCLDRKKADKVALEDPYQFEIKTITSAVKTYLRSLPEPLMTFKLHPEFIAASSEYWRKAIREDLVWWRSRDDDGRGGK